MHTKADFTGRILEAGPARRYVLGGNCKFTVVDSCTGKRFTYKVKSGKKDRDKNWTTGNADLTTYFVSLLTGPNNEDDFIYMGMMKLDPMSGAYVFTLTRNSKVSETAESVLLFKRLWVNIEYRCWLPEVIHFYQEGQCCICGRPLTVPESVRDGIGPECKAKGGM